MMELSFTKQTTPIFSNGTNNLCFILIGLRYDAKNDSIN